MTDYLEQLATADRLRHEQERITAREVICRAAPETERGFLLSVLGLEA